MVQFQFQKILVIGAPETESPQQSGETPESESRLLAHLRLQYGPVLLLDQVES